MLVKRLIARLVRKIVKATRIGSGLFRLLGRLAAWPLVMHLIREYLIWEELGISVDEWGGVDHPGHCEGVPGTVPGHGLEDIISQHLSEQELMTMRQSRVTGGGGALLPAGIVELIETRRISSELRTQHVTYHHMEQVSGWGSLFC